MRTLVTGISGFIGGFVATELLKSGHTVVGIDPSFRILSSDVLHIRKEVEEIELVSLLKSERIDALLHLAGVNHSNDPVRTYERNIMSTAKILEAVRTCKPIRTLLLSSSAIYGEGPSDLTSDIDENYRFQPQNAYGVSKASIDLMGYVSFLVHNVACIRARPFNVVGPGQSQDFLLGQIASQLVPIERAQREPVLKIGNLDSQRDFVDVRDVARALVMLLERGAPGEAYNICSGRATSVKNALEILLPMISIPVQVEGGDVKTPRSGVHYQRGNYRKLQLATRWSPTFDLNQSFFDILDHWRQVK